MEKHSIDRAALRELSAAELLEQINKNELSLLMSIGADDLRREMLPTGFLCRLLVDRVCLGISRGREDDIKTRVKLRKRTRFHLKPLAPVILDKPLPPLEHSMVIGFNHPSLGEILRLIYVGFDAYPECDFLFPVNIPWYEALTPCIEKLNLLGVYITPMITPSTEAKLKKRFEGDEQALTDLQHYKVIFERRYMRTASAMAAKGCAVFVAPSATRQATVFSDHIHPTMTLLARMVLRSPEAKVSFLPITVVEPKNNDRKINLFKKYVLVPCRPFDSEEVRRLTEGKSRGFDIDFLARIEEQYEKFRTQDPKAHPGDSLPEDEEHLEAY